MHMQGARKEAIVALDSPESHSEITLLEQAIEEWRTSNGIGREPIHGALSRKIKEA